MTSASVPRPRFDGVPAHSACARALSDATAAALRSAPTERCADESECRREKLNRASEIGDMRADESEAEIVNRRSEIRW